MEQIDKKITKIVINKNDELTDIVTAILESQNERIVLTFAEETDLLISPINLKVLLETADENERLLIAQIIKNPTGLRNAGLAGLTSIDTPTLPLEDLWGSEEINRSNRLNPPREKIEKKKEEIESEEQKTPTFQEKVDSAIEKSKTKDREKKEAQKKEDFLISLDEDLPIKDTEEIPILVEPDLSKVDFSEKTEDPIAKKSKLEDRGKKFTPPNFRGFWTKVQILLNKIPLPTKFKKLTPLIALSVFLLIILIGFIYINTAMIVKVNIYVEAKEVSIEEVFQGDENIKEIDFENFKIPVKTETSEKARSTNVKATGKAYKGEKAKGKVNITYIKEGCNEEVPPLSLSTGESLSTGGKSYTLDSAISLKCNTPTEGSITAIEVGEEYNLAQGQQFIFQGYSSTQLVVVNGGGAITGGSKEEYNVLSKADVDTAVEELKKIAIEEGENELREKAGNWEIISDSVQSEIIPDSIKTDVAIGAEASEANLSIKTNSVASYFLKEGFDDGVAEMLTNKAKENNLFETDKDWELELDEDIEKEVSVVESNAQGIKIKLTAKSSVKPNIDKQAILEELKKMDWKEGNDYLKSLEFADKETRVDFLPEKFPEVLKRFPKRRGGVLITVVDVN